MISSEKDPKQVAMATRAQITAAHFIFKVIELHLETTFTFAVSHKYMSGLENLLSFWYDNVNYKIE